jgi:hypothetical protein
LGSRFAGRHHRLGVDVKTAGLHPCQPGHFQIVDKPLIEAEAAGMKTVRNSLVLFAANVFLGEAALAQDQSALSHQGAAAQSTHAITLEMKTEPTLAWGSNTRLSGLFVNLITPQKTWTMLNPSVPPQNLPDPVPPHLRPVKAPRPISDPSVHELDFALLRFSF